MSAQSKPQKKTTKKQPPARTLEARENQMIALAFDQAEAELREQRKRVHKSLLII